MNNFSTLALEEERGLLYTVRRQCAKNIVMGAWIPLLEIFEKS